MSLLNVNNKIFGKLLANRIQVVLTELIHPSQTGFVKGRLLPKNILKILTVINDCEERKENGFLISFDIYKAFDTLEYETIFPALEKFGLGEKYIHMAKIIFNSRIAYMAHGLSQYSHLELVDRGVRTRQVSLFSQ